MADWLLGFILVSAILSAPFHWYANQVAYEAARNKSPDKQIWGFTQLAKFGEVNRLAKEGHRFAKVTIAVLRIQLLVTIVAVSFGWFWPVIAGAFKSLEL